MKKFFGMIIAISISLFSYANITVDGNTNVYIEKSNNGIDIINISTPSPKGVSHSTFKDFNVSEKGAVINNAKNIARSHIAGLINGNNNIKETRAKLALLDVTGTEESKLKGILEALSKDKLDVILSNPNGITLDGASFLNIHNMSLTTGKVNIDEDNKINYLKPTGDIKSLKELNTKENLEIVANKFTSDSDIYAKKLNVTTYAGEEGTEISADIIGSVYGDVVKIVATKSGIGVKSITSKDLSLESKRQANIESIRTDNLDIKVEEDFTNRDKIISNNSISIEANNILNDGNILISDNISLKAKENISNLNGAIIHADNILSLESKNLNNIGKVNSYGNPIIKYKDKNGNIIENIEEWKTKLKETYVSYNAGILSSTDEAKINALSAFYDEVVVIDPTEFDWRVWKDWGDVKYNKERAGKAGIFYNLNGSELLSKERIEEIKNKNKEAMYSQYSDNYLGESEENILLKGYVENTNSDTSFSVLSGNNINITTKDVVNNKDGHIIANNDNNIKTNTYNNASSISDETITIQDGYEKMIFDGSFSCPGGLVYCNILHNATYIRDLGNDREVNLKGLPSHIKGENINIDAENVNFKSYSIDESKKTLREEDERYINNKEEIEINGKKIEYNLEDDPRYVKLSNFLNNPYFLNNIKYNSNNRYLIDNFKMNHNNLESKPTKSNITINAKNLNIKEQKLLFDNINLLSNNILVEGAKLKALDNLNIKSDNITLKSIVEEKESYLVVDEVKFINRYEDLKKSSLEANNILVDSKETNLSGDIKVKENIDILSEKVNITGDKITNKSHILNNYTDILVKEEKIDNSTINAKNISIKSKETNIVSSNLNVDNKLNIDSDKLLITSEKTKESKELKTVSNKEYLLDKKEISNSSNINAKEINLNNSNTTINASNVIADKLTGENITVKSDIVNNEYIKKSKNVTHKENTNVNYQENVSSNILVKDIKTKSLDVEGSNVETDRLETKDLNVKSQVLKTDIKQRVETFKLVDNVVGRKDKENLRVDGNVTLFSHKVNKKDNSYEGNERSNILVKEEASIDKLDVLSSNVELNNGKINSLNVRTQDLNNRENENNYSGGLNLSGNAGITGIGAGINLNIENQNIKSKSKIHESSNISLKGNTIIEKELDVTNTNLSYDNLTVNAKEVNFRAIKDETDRTENITGVSLGINVNASSPIAKDIFKMGKGVKNLLDGEITKAISNLANGYVGAVDDLSSNVKIKKSFVDEKNNVVTKYVAASREDLKNIGKKVDKETTKLEKDISAYVNVSAGASLDISNKTILSHKEEVKGNTLSGGNILFNNNDKVNFTSTVVKDSKLVYNNVKEVKKDVLRAENKEEVIDASVSLGIGSSLDTKEMKFSPANINIGVKGSYDLKEEKLNTLNELIDSKEVYNNVENVSIKGLKTKNSVIEGDIKNLSIEEVKDEKTRNKVGVGFDVSLNLSGIPTGGNVEGEFVDKREEKAYKNDLDLSKLNVEKLTVKEEEANNHNIDFGYRVGTSGVSGRVGDLELSTGLVNAIMNPEEFKHKQEMASKDIESTFKGIKSKIDNNRNSVSDELTDIAYEEKRSLRELSNYHLNGEYLVNKINEKSAKDNTERKLLAKEIGFNDLKVYEKLTDENISKYSEISKKILRIKRKRGRVKSSSRSTWKCIYIWRYE
ncbi:filamentous hemagglutinin N-terminal domain-containing protein [Streptobacillus canis]|uniref:filamentous hemagglutinin N-terminal domain-containing protein n=1 Tax=Streptobacillus canis TaxID=2678686 RepID=UPI0012E32D28|nr:filamentous hemagglutinin N-terminal domain-containing protein [Streptobacillus canis]